MKNLLKLSLSLIFFSLPLSTQAITTAEAKHELFEALNHQLAKEIIKNKKLFNLYKSRSEENREKLREQIYLEQIRKNYYKNKRKSNKHKTENIPFFDYQDDSEYYRENEDNCQKQPTELSINLWLNYLIFPQNKNSNQDFVKVDNEEDDSWQQVSK
jgi:hypothetical protein